MKNLKPGQFLTSGLLCFLVGLLGSGAMAAEPELMIVGQDEKYVIKETGGRVFAAPGRDTVSIVDIGTDPEEPKIIANLPLMNSIFGPPTNLAITPDKRLAIIANSMNWVQDGDKWKPKPNNKLHVIDLTADPPAHITTIEVGMQPSGLAISPAGDMALIANRAGKSISVVSIKGKEVKLIDTVDMGEKVAAVAITPDGKRALAVMRPAHKIALLEIDGQKVAYNNYDMPVGVQPYNVQITPNGKLALTANHGPGPDGHADTVSVIDLEAKPPRVIDHVVVGDAPEGLVISPTGEIAVAVLIKGSGSTPLDAWFRNRNGSLAVLDIEGKKVTKLDEVEVRGLPEGAVFSPDGRYLYIGNFTDSDISILKVEGKKVINTGKLLKLPGHPASMRGVNP